MRSLRLLLALGAFLATAAAQAAIIPALTFSGGTLLPSDVSESANQSIGWSFTVTAPVTVTGLQYFDDSGDGLDTSHEVGLWSSGGTLLASTVIPAGMSAPLVGGMWREGSILPIRLVVGATYIVGGQNSADTFDPFACGGGSCDAIDVHLMNHLQFDAVRFSNFGGFQFPALTSAGADFGFFGPSLAVVPEPGSLALLATALLGLVGFARSRKG